MEAIGFYLFYGITWIITLLPLRVLYILSDLLYLFTYYFPGYRRKVVSLNLKNAFPEKNEKEQNNQFRWPFGPRNYMVFALAIVIIIIGYISLGQGSITLAPVLLVLGYCVLIPVSLIIKSHPRASGSSDQTTES